MSYPRPDRDFQERAYQEQLGKKALDRQKVFALARFKCCWQPKALGHHPLCSAGQKARPP